MCVFHTEPCGKFLLKLVGKPTGRQPEVQRGVGQRAHLLLIKNTGSVVDTVAGDECILLFFEITVIGGNQLLNLLARLCFISPPHHIFCTLLYLIINYKQSS